MKHLAEKSCGSGDFDEEEHLVIVVPYSCSYSTCLTRLGALGGGGTPCDSFFLSRRFSSISRGVTGVRFLTELSICRISIEHLPSQIGSLKHLKKLDVSFNKLRHLPDSVSGLSALKSLKAAYNKLVDIPSYICDLKKLQSLDLSNNRLTSEDVVNIAFMPALQHINLQDNKASVYSHVLPGVCRNKYWVQRAELFDIDIQAANCVNSFVDGCCTKLYASESMIKGGRHRDSLQEKACEEHLNYSRSLWLKVRPETVAKSSTCRSYLDGTGKSESWHGVIVDVDVEVKNESLKTFPSFGTLLTSIEHSGAQVVNNCKSSDSLPENSKGSGNMKSDCSSGSCISTEDADFRKNIDLEDEADSLSAACVRNQSKPSRISPRKRHCGDDLCNPKSRKSCRVSGEGMDISLKYSSESLCSYYDHLPDGFYDAGRHRPFLPLHNYDESMFDSREVIVLDRRRDEELDGILLSARFLLARLKTFCDSPVTEQLAANDFQRASVLALFVSDIFGGSDRSSFLAKIKKAASGSNKQQPFVCTCSAVNTNNVKRIYQGSMLGDLCEISLRLIKKSCNSNVIPIGELQLGVCRHRSLLMKYLCDRMDPPIPCELVRGYLDYMPHAWNVVLVQHGDVLIRMVVDTCYPTDIRAETDPEYYCRYIPLSRILLPLPADGLLPRYSFPLVSIDHETNQGLYRNVSRCRFGTLDAAVKVRSLELSDASDDDLKTFEYGFLGEVRILGALKNHKCIVEMYGHQLSSKFSSSAKCGKERSWVQSMIVMEYMNGGSLKTHLEELSARGEKHVPLDLALHIARNVAHALVDVHSKHIIHRDIKSENVLIDIGSKRMDGSPCVKLSDFDVAVPLGSSLHSCCIAHVGVHPPNVCVGTPRWMAPEVLKALHVKSAYGLEVDIWSYGCLLFELLTLKIPYDGLLDSEIYNLVLMGERPTLAPELEQLLFLDPTDLASCISRSNYSSTELKILKLLIKLFYHCTCCHPEDRPTARQIYDLINDVLPPVKEAGSLFYSPPPISIYKTK